MEEFEHMIVEEFKEEDFYESIEAPKFVTLAHQTIISQKVTIVTGSVPESVSNLITLLFVTIITKHVP